MAPQYRAASLERASEAGYTNSTRLFPCKASAKFQRCLARTPLRENLKLAAQQRLQQMPGVQRLLGAMRGTTRA